MRLFLDSSVLLAACGSAAGASREIYRRAEINGWELITTPYVIDEVECNLPNLQPSATDDWAFLRKLLSVMDDVLTLDRPAIFGPSKDRPILFSALAWADVLLTLDQNDFGGFIGKPFYGLRVLRPGQFLAEERAACRLI